MEKVEFLEKEFDLQQLFALNYSFDKLKDVLAYLLQANKAQNNRIKDLEKEAARNADTLANHQAAIQDLNNSSGLEDLENLKERVEKLEKRSDKIEEEIYETNHNLEHTRKGIERALTSVCDQDRDDDDFYDDVYDRSKDSFLQRQKKDDANKTDATVIAPPTDEQPGERSMAERLAEQRQSDEKDRGGSRGDKRDITSGGDKRDGRQQSKGDRSESRGQEYLGVTDQRKHHKKHRDGDRSGNPSRDRQREGTIGVEYYRRPLRDSRIIDIERRLENLEKLLGASHSGYSGDDIKNVYSSGEPGTGGQADFSRILAKLRAEIAERYASKDSMGDIQGRLKRVEEKARKNEFDIEKLKELLQELRDLIDKKADLSALEDLSALVQQLLSSGGNQSAGISKLLKEQQKLKELIEKVQNLENFTNQVARDQKKGDEQLAERITKIEKEMNFKANRDDIERIDGVMRDLNNELKALRKDLHELQERVAALEDNFQKMLERLDLLEQRLSGILKKISDLSSRQSVVKPAVLAPEQSSANLSDIYDKLQNLKSELANLKREFGKQLKDLEAKVDQKADQDALVDLENKILQKLDAVISTLNKKFADKAETKKAIRALDKQLRHLLDNLHNQGAEGDDAMFARKPLGGWSCASCEKGLINLYGLMAEYYPWSRFPLRDPQDRIARVGQGFSKMLSKLDPQAMGGKDHHISPRALSPEMMMGEGTHQHSLDGTQTMPDRNYSKSTPYLPHLQNAGSPQMPHQEHTTGQIVGGTMMRNESLPKIAKIPKQI